MKQYQRIVIVGGGSAQWTPDSVMRMACSSSLRNAEVVLYDIDVQRAWTMANLCNKMLARAYPDAGLRLSAVETLDEALPGAEVVFTCYCNLGLQVEQKISEISRRYGSNQCCFTAGPGAVIYVATQTPTMINLAQAMLRHCPDAWLINCSNPLPAMVMVAVKAGLDPRKVLGFCGAISWTRTSLARFLQVEPERLDFRIGGTNHCTFITEVLIDGEDAYPRLREQGRTQNYFDMGCWGHSTMEINLLRATGYLASPGHASDIFPTIHGEWLPPTEDAPPKPANYAQGFQQRLEAFARGEEVELILPSEREVPFSWLDALAGDTGEQHFSINTMNCGAVSNLPDWAVPDLECHLDQRGVSPLAGPPLPEVIAEVVRRHQVTFEMAARAAVTRDHDLLVQAIQLCPFGDYMQSAEQILADARAAFGEELIL